MGKNIDAGWVPADDPMFNGSWSVFSIRKPKQSTEPGKPEKPGKTEAKKPSKRRPKAISSRKIR
jgi:hypothetical protein